MGDKTGISWNPVLALLARAWRALNAPVDLTDEDRAW